jgi:hypothetical protein
MKSIVTFALSAALAALVATPAFAGDHHDEGAFPMKADVFKQKVEERLTHKKAKMEKRITDNKLDAAKAKEMREHFDARAAKIRAAAATAAQDGVVTKEEARDVRKAGGHHHKGGDKK